MREYPIHTEPFNDLNLQFSFTEEEKIKRQVNFDLIKSLAKSLLPNLLIQFGITFFLFLFIYHEAEPSKVWHYFFILILINAVSYFLLAYFWKNKLTLNKMQIWKKRYIAASAIVTGTWGILSYALLPEDNLTLQFFIVFSIFALSASFAQATITELFSCRLSITLLLFPLTIWCFSQKTIAYYGMAVILLVYIVFLYYITNRGNQLLKASLMLRYKNIKLNQKLKIANTVLEQTVLERTEQVQQAKDQAEAANHAKTEFLGLISHELRTPLRVIDSANNGLKKYLPNLIDSSEMAVNAQLTDEIISDSECQHIVALCNRIAAETETSFSFINLLLSSLGNIGGTVTQSAYHQMNDCIKAALIVNKNVIAKFDNNLDFTFFGNEQLMTHVLVNLITLLSSDSPHNNAVIHITVELKSSSNALKIQKIVSEDADVHHSIVEQANVSFIFSKMIINSFSGTLTDIKTKDAIGYVLQLPAVASQNTHNMLSSANE